MNIFRFASRKYKKQEQNLQSQLEKMKAEHQETLRRLESTEQENNRMALVNVTICSRSEKGFDKSGL